MSSGSVSSDQQRSAVRQGRQNETKQQQLAPYKFKLARVQRSLTLHHPDFQIQLPPVCSVFSADTSLLHGTTAGKMAVVQGVAAWSTVYLSPAAGRGIFLYAASARRSVAAA